MDWIVTGVSIRLRILKAYSMGDRQTRHPRYRGIDPFEDTEREEIRVLVSQIIEGYRGIDPFEDTESFTLDHEPRT